MEFEDLVDCWCMNVHDLGKVLEDAQAIRNVLSEVPAFRIE